MAGFNLGNLVWFISLTHPHTKAKWSWVGLSKLFPQSSLKRAGSSAGKQCHRVHAPKLPCPSCLGRGWGHLRPDYQVRGRKSLWLTLLRYYCSMINVGVASHSLHAHSVIHCHQFDPDSTFSLLGSSQDMKMYRDLRWSALCEVESCGIMGKEQLRTFFLTLLKRLYPEYERLKATIIFQCCSSFIAFT